MESKPIHLGDDIDGEQLLLLIARRDESAFEQFYDYYAPTVFGLCLRVLGNRQDAEIVLSEVFLEIWENAAKFDPSRGRARTYLMMLARSRAIDHLRSLAGRRERASSADADLRELQTIRREQVDPAKQAGEAEQHENLRTAIAALPDNQKCVIELAYFQGLTHREIAEQTSTPLGTVKTNIRSGVSSLRRIILNGRPEPPK
jgi:RNA polymerase sigma-70 factor, ECF subfamily